MEKWHDGLEFQRIGDIMVKNAPFLKMYTEYVKNFDTAMNTINTLYAKNSKFAAIMEEIHVSVLLKFLQRIVLFNLFSEHDGM